MATKICVRGPKESGNHNRKQEALPDEIALRDEILELKRQMMLLRRTNEQYSVRLRKYEDEARRKDRELEQLMNPRKNADVAKVLSSKGAAMVMNLRDQNNALVQMLVSKDLHIRRLVAEVKMSKLYSSTKRGEGYRAEISRLRSLLMKSEEALRESAEVQQGQGRSICVGGNPIPDFSSSSDQSSPRDLDELRCTVLRLETHIKHSNDLLAQKNHEISLLSDELNLLRKYIRHKASKADVCDCDCSAPRGLSTKTFTRSWPGPLNSKLLSSQDLLDFFEKQPTTDHDHLSRSAPAALTKLPSSSGSTPEHKLPMAIDGDTEDHQTDTSVVVTTTTKSLFHDLAASEVLKEKMLSRGRKPLLTKNKWKQALTKFRELQKLKQRPVAETQNRESLPKVEMMNSEAQELEIMQKEISKEAEVSVDEEKSLKKLKSEESPGKNISAHFNNSEFSVNYIHEKDISRGSCQTPENYSSSNSSEKCSAEQLGPSNEAKHPDSINFSPNGSPHFQTEPKPSPPDDSEMANTRQIKSLREVYSQSLDSSFDSENSYTMKHEVRQVRVEVQINSVSAENYKEQSEISGSSLGETGGHHTPNWEFNDDDDVIVR